MRLVSGLARPLRGQLRLLGRDPARVPAADLARMLGMVFQNADRQFLTARADEVALACRHLRLPAPRTPPAPCCAIWSWTTWPGASL